MKRGVNGKPRVEYDPGWGWIARKADGSECWPDFRWSSRSVARDVCEQYDRDDATLSTEQVR